MKAYPHLLIVNDSAAGMNDMMLAAEVAKYSEDLIVQAVNESEANAHIESQKPIDVGVIDIQLTPFGQEGLVVIKKLREMHEKAYIICVTAGRPDRGTLGAKAMQNGANNFINLEWRNINGINLLAEYLRIYRCLFELSKSTH